MKKVLFLFTAMLLLTVYMNGQASHAVKLNPLGALFGNIGVGYEHGLGETTSVQLGVSFFSRSFDVSAFDSDGDIISGDQKFSGIGFVPEFRFYFDSAIEGWYGGVFANYNSIKFKTEYSSGSDDLNSESSITNVGAGAEFGKQWLLGSNENFVIDLNLGAGFQSASVDSDNGDDDDDIEFGLAASGVWPKLSFSVGYAF
jgi:hypothetical protein